MQDPFICKARLIEMSNITQITTERIGPLGAGIFTKELYISTQKTLISAKEPGRAAKSGS